MRDIINIEANLVWAYCQDHNSQTWVGVCEPLKLTVEGDTFAQMQDCMSEAVNAVLLEMLSTGDFDRFLEDHGWRLTSDTVPVREREVYFDVPFTTRRVAQHDLEAALC